MGILETTILPIFLHLALCGCYGIRCLPCARQGRNGHFGNDVSHSFDFSVENKVSVDVKRKYLHVEINFGRLYVYADSTAWDKSKEVRLSELDRECDVGSARSVKHIRIPIEDFVK